MGVALLAFATTFATLDGLIIEHFSAKLGGGGDFAAAAAVLS